MMGCKAITRKGTRCRRHLFRFSRSWCGMHDPRMIRTRPERTRSRRRLQAARGEGQR